MAEFGVQVQTEKDAASGRGQDETQSGTDLAGPDGPERALPTLMLERLLLEDIKREHDEQEGVATRASIYRRSRSRSASGQSASDKSGGPGPQTQQSSAGASSDQPLRAAQSAASHQATASPLSHDNADTIDGATHSQAK